MGRRALLVIFLAVLFVLIAVATARLPTADFYVTFYSAGRSVLNGRSPYDASGYVCAPWGVIPFVPLALLQAFPAHGVYFAICLYLLVYVAWRLRASPLTILAFMISPTAIGLLLVGNLDAVVLSGMLFPPALGLFILMIKPQIGTGVALYYLIDYVRRKRWLEGLRAFSPVTAGYLLSLGFFPVFYISMLRNTSIVWNRSLFPYAVPVGLLLLWLAVRRRNPYFALASTAFFAPYLSFYTYIIVQIGLLHEDVEKYIRRDVLQILLTVFLWAIMLAFRL